MLGRFTRSKSSSYEETGKHLFDGEYQMFVSLAREAKAYLEYGLGESTVWIDRETSVSIVGVDTSLDWVSKMKSLMQRDGHSLSWVDVGPLGDWGMPLGYAKRSAFRDYVLTPWTLDPDPDLILIDGRFRLSCFFYSISRAKPGCHILFDDYVSRTPFHIIEEFYAPTIKSSRQAVFTVPENVQVEEMERLAESFMMVRD